jgi:tripartite-type tricarboxylate transporter receptor subunit TctC
MQKQIAMAVAGSRMRGPAMSPALLPTQTTRRLFALGLALLICGAATARADDYPSKPIRMIVPFSPGGPVDIMGRQMAQKLSDVLGQPVIVENRPGANGTVGSAQVAKSPPDGYTLLMQSGSHTANPSIYAKLPYDPLKDFIGITELADTSGMVLVVHPDFPAKNIQEFIALAKANPKKYTYGHGGVGNATHVSAELFKSVAGISILPVPYTGGGGPIAALLGKEIDVSFSATTAITSYVKSGRMKALVMTGAARSPVLPDVPAVGELGFKDGVFEGFFGLWFPKGTPPERVERMHKAAVAALATPEMQRYLTDGGATTIGSTPAEFAKFLEQDLALQTSIAKRIGLKPVQ